MNYSTAGQSSMDGMQSQATEPDPDIALQNENLVDKYDEEKLTKIGYDCLRGFEIDKESRHDWEKDADEWINLAQQLREEKSYPWAGASNVKYPLLSTAAMQFAARAYPSLVPSNGKIVKTKVIGKDPSGQKYDRSERVSMYMSYQLMHEIPNWEEEMDKMLMMLPVIGTIFKKTYYDKIEDAICSHIILPKNIVVNYWTKNLENAERISEIIEVSQRLVKERQNLGIYRDVDLGVPVAPNRTDEHVRIDSDDDTVPYELIEQHTFIDLDDDGYPEPYIVLFERTRGIVLRINRRYKLDDVETEGKKILRIKPIQYYTKFGFVPNPDGSFYDIGFGVLLGPLNHSVSTLINQLIDAGTINNLQSGFIGKALKMKTGDQKFTPGEWKPVNATGDDLRKQIIPLPTKEPSAVLFQLMGTLITSGKELASVAEIFVGKMPGQNTPATTTMASIEQGMKVFTAVYKRIFRSLEQEFKKIFHLNKMYIDPQHYTDILDTTVGPDDFDEKSYDICPGADPTAVSQTEKLLKAQGLLELMPMVPGMLDPIKVVSRVLEAQEQPNWQELFTQEVQKSGQLPPAPPDPKMMAVQAKMQADQQKAQLDAQAKQQSMEIAGREAALKEQMAQQEHAQKMQEAQDGSMLQAASSIALSHIKNVSTAADTTQKLHNTQQLHQQKMEHAKEQTRLLASKQSKTGNEKKKQ
jgi:chaperonin GroES